MIFNEYDVCTSKRPDQYDEEEDEMDDVLLTKLGAIPQDALRVLLALVAPDLCRSSRCWRTATVRLAALCWTLDVNGWGGIPQARLAEILEVNRGTLNLSVIRLRDFAGLSCAGGRSEEARANYSDRNYRVLAEKRAAGIMRAKGAEEDS